MFVAPTAWSGAPAPVGPGRKPSRTITISPNGGRRPSRERLIFLDSRLRDAYVLYMFYFGQRERDACQRSEDRGKRTRIRWERWLQRMAPAVGFENASRLHQKCPLLSRKISHSNQGTMQNSCLLLYTCRKRQV